MCKLPLRFWELVERNDMRHIWVSADLLFSLSTHSASVSISFKREQTLTLPYRTSRIGRTTSPSVVLLVAKHKPSHTTNIGTIFGIRLTLSHSVILSTVLTYLIDSYSPTSPRTKTTFRRIVRAYRKVLPAVLTPLCNSRTKTSHRTTSSTSLYLSRPKKKLFPACSAIQGDTWHD